MLGRLTHAEGMIGFRQLGINEPPPKGGVENLRPPGKRLRVLGHDKRRTTHAFHPASDHHLPVATGNGPGSIHDRLQPRGAKPVDRDTRHRRRKPRQQGSHAGYVPVVLARLVRRTCNHIGNRFHRHFPVPMQQCTDGNGQKIIRTHRTQTAAVSSDRGP